MQVKVIEEHGYESAVLGISLSYHSTVERAKEIANNLAHKGGGHSKCLESIQVWLDITAPRFYWSEADTYRHATKQSSSTLHTITKRPLAEDDFEYGVRPYVLEDLNNLIAEHNSGVSVQRKKELFLLIKNNLPEGFLQRRIMCLNYMSLQNIIRQRTGHRLPQWKVFIDSVLAGVEHPEFLT